MFNRAVRGLIILRLNTMKKTLLSILVFVLAQYASAQKVIFPQQQQAGPATMMAEGDSYVLANDLLSASFTHADGKLSFGGCEAMGMLPSEDLFSIRLASGTEVASSAMTLKISTYPFYRLTDPENIYEENGYITWDKVPYATKYTALLLPTTAHCVIKPNCTDTKNRKVY